MPWRDVFSSDTWRRYVLQTFSAICVRRVVLRVRRELLANDFLLIASSERVAAQDYRRAVDDYWAAYWFLGDLRQTLDDEEDNLVFEWWEAQGLILLTHCLQHR